MSTEEITAIAESAAAQNLIDYVEAYRRVAAEADAAALPIAGGVAAHVGAGSPLTSVKGCGPSISDSDLDAIEGFFAARGVRKVTIEAAPWLDRASRRRLDARGYACQDVEHVVFAIAEATDEPAWPVESMAAEEWSALMLRGFELPNQRRWLELCRAAAHLPGSTPLGVRDAAGVWFACGALTPAAEATIFACDATLPEARGRGAQTALIRHRLRLTPRGRLAIAEVAPGGVSERNYLRCGFQLAYARACFQKSDNQVGTDALNSKPF
jgi:GNAT superfamily N-acetyltransferase